MGCPRTDASQASVSSASLTASRPRPQTQPSLKRRRGKRFISLQISQSQPGEGPSLASPGGTEETGPAAEERSVRREVAPPPASASASTSTPTPTPAPRGTARSHLPGTAHAAGGGGTEVRRVFSRPHPTWPRRPRLLTPPGPSAHVPRAAPGRPRHRPDWQRAPANRGGERLLPANGSGGPRRTAGRRSAPPVRTLSARRPMAAPEERRGSARPPPAPRRGGGGCRDNRRPAGGGRPWRPRPLAHPGKRRGTSGRAAELRLLPPPSSLGGATSCAGGAAAASCPSVPAAPPPAPTRPAGQRPARGRGAEPAGVGTAPAPRHLRRRQRRPAPALPRRPAAAAAGGSGRVLGQRRPRPSSPAAAPQRQLPPACASRASRWVSERRCFGGG